jgi:hypothetical protein
LKREGEDVMAQFLASDARFVPVTARDVLGRARTEGVATASGRYLRTWRFEASAGASGAGASPAGADGLSASAKDAASSCDGFFAAVARRKEAAGNEPPAPERP